MTTETCPVCGGPCLLLGEVDLNRSAAEVHGTKLAPAGVPIRYVLCAGCGFAFAPEMCRWSLAEFETRIYNRDYIRVDPDHAERRPRENARALAGLFGDRKEEIRHLDYGGGTGLLSKILREEGWNSRSYDPFFDRNARVEELGKFNLVTALEVFEHVPDVDRLVSELSALLEEEGLVFFSTLLSDGNIGAGRPLDWWYAAPRNGHVSLYSSRSLAILGGKQGFRFGSLNEVTHVLCRKVPSWAARYIAP